MIAYGPMQSTMHSMDLKKFITESIQQVVEGMLEAQHLLGDRVRINPKWDRSRHKDNMTDKFEALSRQRVYSLSFDVAVTTRESASGESKVEVVDAVSSTENERKRETITEAVSRLRFSIHFTMPHPPVPSEHPVAGTATSQTSRRGTPEPPA